jgi:phage gpG-like protein
MRLTYEVEGIGKVEHDMLGMAERALEPRPILEAFAAELRQMEQDLFDAQGGGKWPPLAASTIERKGHDTILVDSGALEKSLVDEHAEGHLEEIIGNELLFGTNLTSDDGTYYPGLLRSGTKNMPARDPLIFQEQDLRRFSKAVQAWLVGAERAEFGVGSFGGGMTVPFGA